MINQLDISAIPFSRFGTYIAFSQLAGKRQKRKELPEGIWMRSVHGDAAYEIMQFELIEDGVPCPCETSCTASVLSLRTPSGHADICIPTADTVRIRVERATLRITARPFRNHGAIPEPEGSWIFNMAASFRSYRLVPLAGAFSVEAPWTVKHCEFMIAELSATDDEIAEMAIEELTWMRPAKDHSVSFDHLSENVQQEFEQFCKPLVNCCQSFQSTAATASYLNWSSVVHPHRLLKRPAMYMSKNWMTNVWSWDHAFNAMATSLCDPDLAWDQLMVIFDHQDENGQIPDFINDVRYLTCFVKPPIHGWALSRMIRYGGPLPIERVEEAYTKLSRWTDWWLTFRVPDNDGLPVYWHGNDSGWDNGTVFDVPPPLKSADLAAFLILQMDVLADLAMELKRTSDSQLWRDRANATLKALIDNLWDGRRFRSISTVTGEAASQSDSVFGALPIILGLRLPKGMRDALVTQIRRHLTPWGPATEHPDSPLYTPDGYWRGPIWAPPTMILIDGLQSAGETTLARDIAERFCNLCGESGFAENFNAITGEPLCDPAYTWTSSVFLVLANKYLTPLAGDGISTRRDVKAITPY